MIFQYEDNFGQNGSEDSKAPSSAERLNRGRMGIKISVWAQSYVC